jgi:hypothetical protein
MYCQCVCVCEWVRVRRVQHTGTTRVQQDIQTFYNQHQEKAYQSEDTA